MNIDKMTIFWRAKTRVFLLACAMALTSAESAAISPHCALGEVASREGTITVSGSVNASKSEGGLWWRQVGSKTYSGVYHFKNEVGQCVDDPEYSPTPPLPPTVS
jgi:hypothetical protein